ncbi:nucleotide-binding protein [Bacteroidota bacterium]
MKVFVYLVFPILLFTAGCGNDETNSDEKVQTSDMRLGSRSGEVIDKIDAGSYSYLQLKENDQVYWAAVPTMKIENGEQIFFSEYMEMKNFKSETLDRTFESVLFVNDANKVADKKTLQMAHANLKPGNETEISVEPLDGGKTIAQIFNEKETLKNKTVKVRGKVVKFNGGIMNRNWIHIQDGTDNNGEYDLLITSNETAKVGDTITAEGKLATDKDFGAGYFYPVLVEDAKIIIE